MRQESLTALHTYVRSERFILDGLLADGEKLVAALFPLWAATKAISPSLILFPSEHLRDDAGETINGVVGLDLPEEGPHQTAIEQAVTRTKAYAFFYVRTAGASVRALLESPHGTRTWVMPLVRSADVLLLCAPQISNDVESLEILWHKGRGRA